MKKLLLILTLGLSFLASCTVGIKSTAKGLESESYLEFLGEPKNYEAGLDVLVDETIAFTAQVKKPNKVKSKGLTYAIATGKHTITVKHNNNVIYSKQIFVSAQETKQILLP